MTASGASELQARRTAAYALLRREPDHRDAHLRLYEIEQILGAPAAAVAHLRAALRDSAVVAPVDASAGAVRVLALTRIARWEANVPLELVVDESRIALTRLYLDGSERLDDVLASLPAHDVLVNAIAESDDAQPALALAARVVEAAGGGCVNDPRVVAGLRRDAVSQAFAASRTVVAPAVERLTPAELAARRVDGPLVVRPVGSQAGAGLARVATTAELRAHAAHHPAAAYYVMPFVDYRGADGFFRKYRVMFVDGTPYACHLAISPRWMIHYYNAPMSEHAWMRDEEAAFLAGVEHVFSGRLADALREIAAAVPLGYFGIDCSIASDGRLLLFEADAAMLVHGSDPADLFPYKRAAFERIKAALTAYLERSYGNVSGR
jgi:glutathione synthase/RimK-type ligase-like ATP-grasp enzyme